MLQEFLLNPIRKNRVIFSLFFIVYFCLLFFRYPHSDELYYLNETVHMSDILSKCQWIGNEGVGLHGFLFKLPMALLFIVTGPSVFITSLYYIILSLFVVLLFYRILNKYFHDKYIIAIGVIILSTNFYFFNSTTRYLREIPVLVSLLLFLNFILNNRNKKLLIGLSLLLILDAKEHVFFQILPGLILWLFYSNIFADKNNSYLFRLKNLIIDCLWFFIPSIFYLYLMFFTGLVPVNMFAAYILGLIDKGFKSMIGQFTKAGTYGGVSKEELQSSPIISYFNLNFKEINNYFCKFFFPGMCSLITTPKIFIVPAFISSWICIFKKDTELKEDAKLLFLILWSYFLIFYLRAAHGRYFFPIFPIIIIFFLQFINNIKFDKKSIIIIIISIVMIAFGFSFEYKSILIKIFIDIGLIFIFLILLYNNEKTILKRKYCYILAGIVYGTVFFSLSIYHSVTIGQIKNYMIHGYCGEMDKVAATISGDTKIWLNDYYENYNMQDYNLIKFYRRDYILTPEWKWKLQDWIPKRATLHVYPDERTFSYEYNDIKELKEKLLKDKIEKVYFFHSCDKRKQFYRQEDLNIFLKQSFLKLEKTLKLKNKDLYIFDVI